MAAPPAFVFRSSCLDGKLIRTSKAPCVLCAPLKNQTKYQFFPLQKNGELRMPIFFIPGNAFIGSSDYRKRLASLFLWCYKCAHRLSSEPFLPAGPGIGFRQRTFRISGLPEWKTSESAIDGDSLILSAMIDNLSNHNQSFGEHSSCEKK